MRAVAIMAAAVLLAGCAHVMTSGPRSVVVMAGAMAFDTAQQTAEAECAKQGLHARFAQKLTPMQYSYDCVR